MKYLYHHRTLGINVEGVHIHSICNALVDLGHQVKLVSINSIHDSSSNRHFSNHNSDNPSNLNTRPSVLKSMVRNIPEPFFELLEFFYNFYSFFRLWYVIHHYKPDRIYERYSLYLFSTLLLARLYSIPIVYEINDSAQLERLRPLFFQKISSQIERIIFRYANGLVFVSKRLQSIITSAYPSMTTLSIVSHNASNKSIFSSDHRLKMENKNRLKLGSKIVCGFIGCFAPWHGIDTFMSVIAPQLKHYPDLTLLLVGDGKTLKSIRQIQDNYQLGNQVIITGNIPHEEIINYIHAMDFSVLPSSNEYGSPMKIFELMGAGIPLLAANYPPIAEIIEDNKDGWLFPINDIDTCIEKLFSLYQQPEQVNSAALLAEKKIHNHYQWANNAEDLEQLYQSCASQIHHQNTLG